MKAAMFSEYGGVDVLEVKDVPVPALEEGHVLVKVKASGVNPKDTFVRKGRFMIFSGTVFPQMSGYDFAGVVEEAGQGVVHVRKGDRVYGYLDDPSMLGGAAAEFVLAKAHQVGSMPRSVDFVRAASLPCAALTALQALRDIAGISEGDRVCINGASGGVGVFAVQIAASVFGAHVTAICSGPNHPLVKELGAGDVSDYAVEDITETGRRFKIFLDVFGNQDYKAIMNILLPGGIYITTVPGKDIMNRRNEDLGGRRAELVAVQSVIKDLELLSGWVDQGLIKPVIDRIYPLDRIREAHSHVESKHTRGKVVVEIA
jgi:NADPH:quinone reductase-like Zn-dependent oxidoreductase